VTAAYRNPVSQVRQPVRIVPPRSQVVNLANGTASQLASGNSLSLTYRHQTMLLRTRSGRTTPAPKDEIHKSLGKPEFPEAFDGGRGKD
jgi:hypothetical protein